MSNVAPGGQIPIVPGATGSGSGSTPPGGAGGTDPAGSSANAPPAQGAPPANLGTSPYPPLGEPAAAPTAGTSQLGQLLRGATRTQCPTWTPPEKGAPIETYQHFRKRFIIYVEGELLIGIPPGLVAREITLNSQGGAHDLLIEFPRDKLYQPTDPNAVPPTRSGLEQIIELLDIEYGEEVDDIEDQAVNDYESHWRLRGQTMNTFRTEHHRRYKKSKDKAQLSMSDNYRAKRLGTRAQITKIEKTLLMGKVDGDWSKFTEIDKWLGKLFKYQDGSIPPKDQVWNPTFSTDPNPPDDGTWVSGTSWVDASQSMLLGSEVLPSDSASQADTGYATGYGAVSPDAWLATTPPSSASGLWGSPSSWLGQTTDSWGSYRGWGQSWDWPSVGSWPTWGWPTQSWEQPMYPTQTTVDTQQEVWYDCNTGVSYDENWQPVSTGGTWYESNEGNWNDSAASVEDRSTQVSAQDSAHAWLYGNDNTICYPVQSSDSNGLWWQKQGGCGCPSKGGCGKVAPGGKKGGWNPSGNRLQAVPSGAPHGNPVDPQTGQKTLCNLCGSDSHWPGECPLRQQKVGGVKGKAMAMPPPQKGKGPPSGTKQVIHVGTWTIERQERQERICQG